MTSRYTVGTFFQNCKHSTSWGFWGSENVLRWMDRGRGGGGERDKDVESSNTDSIESGVLQWASSGSALSLKALIKEWFIGLLESLFSNPSAEWDFFYPFKGFGKSSLPGKDPGRTMSMYYWRRVIKRYNHGSTGGSPAHADIYLSCQCQRNKISTARHWVIPLRSASNLCAEWIHGKFLSVVLIDKGKMALLIYDGNIVCDLSSS